MLNILTISILPIQSINSYSFSQQQVVILSLVTFLKSSSIKLHMPYSSIKSIEESSSITHYFPSKLDTAVSTDELSSGFFYFCAIVFWGYPPAGAIKLFFSTEENRKLVHFWAILFDQLYCLTFPCLYKGCEKRIRLHIGKACICACV